MFQLVERKAISIGSEDECTYGLRIVKEKWVGEDGQIRTYWKYCLPDVVQVAGLTRDGKLIAIEEWQPSVGANYVHFVGETLEEGENALEAARRGLLEETGYEGESVELVSTILHDSARSDRAIHLVIARNCKKTGAPEKDIRIKLYEPLDFWRLLMAYFSGDPASKHGGANTLQLASLLLHRIGLTV
jgi:ADP-ribose pyrophosphatase YjhB (NUDIX family)